jgi:hypothetical protein
MARVRYVPEFSMARKSKIVDEYQIRQREVGAKEAQREIASKYSIAACLISRFQEQVTT